MNRISIAFRPGSLLPQLQERTKTDSLSTAGLVSKRDLERFYTVLPEELSHVGLDRGQALLLLDVIRETWPEGMDTTSITLLPASIEHELTRRGTSERKLVDRLRGLCAGARLAVVDAVERAARLVADGRLPEDALRQVRLI